MNDERIERLYIDRRYCKVVQIGAGMGVRFPNDYADYLAIYRGNVFSMDIFKDRRIVLNKLAMQPSQEWESDAD